ncbi:MAG: hypothetical protein ABFR62_09925 [Bacteroidota bacterium]
MVEDNLFEQPHKEHLLWKQDLLKTDKEVKELVDSLSSIVDGSSLDKSQAKSVEHLQNSFIRQKQVINNILARVKVLDKNMSRFWKERHELRAVSLTRHSNIKDEMVQFDKLYDELRSEFDEFIEKIGFKP